MAHISRLHNIADVSPSLCREHFLPLWFRLQGERILVLHGVLLVSLQIIMMISATKTVLFLGSTFGKTAQKKKILNKNGQIDKF